MTSETLRNLFHYCQDKNFDDRHPRWKHFYLTHDVIRIFQTMTDNHIYGPPRHPIHYGD